MPVMVFPTSPASSCWTIPSRSAKQAEDACIGIPDVSMLINGDTPPNELHVRSPVRRTPDINFSDTIRLDGRLPVQKSSVVDTDHCEAIIQALRTPFLDIRTFDNVSPAEFHTILQLSSEHKRNQIPAKLIYDSSFHKLVAMAPYPIHEIPFQHLSKRVDKFLKQLSLDEDDDIACEFRFNLAIDGEDAAIIPNIHLDLRPLHRPGFRPIPFWVGECGFSSNRTEMERQLTSVAATVPEMDVAIMVFIRKANHPLPPHDHPLHSRPVLSRDAFTPVVAPRDYSLGSVVVNDITWLEVKSIIVRVFLRGPDGEFHFRDGGPLFAQGTLYPDIQMDAVSTILGTALRRLVLQISRMMETIGADPVKISRLQAESNTALFPADWPRLVRDLQNSVYDTAYARYCRWWRSEPPKRKEQPEPLPLEDRRASDLPHPGLPLLLLQERTCKRGAPGIALQNGRVNFADSDVRGASTL